MKPRYEKESKVIAANLRAIMARKKVRAPEIAIMLGVRKQFVQAILRDDQVLYHPDAVAIAKYLQVDIKEFTKK